MIRPKDLSDCDCSPWQKLKQQIQALYEAVTQLGYKNTEQDGEIAGLDLRVTALEDAPVVVPEWGAITGDLEDQTDLKDALDGKADASSLASVALSGDYDDLSNKPTIPDAQVQADWNEADTTAVDFIKNKPTIPAEITVDASMIQNSTNPVQSKVIQSALQNKPDIQVWNQAPSTSDVGVEGDFWLDTATNTLYQCTAADPSIPSYTWNQVGGGGSGPVTNMGIQTNALANIGGTEGDTTAATVATNLTPTYLGFSPDTSHDYIVLVDVSKVGTFDKSKAKCFLASCIGGGASIQNGNLTVSILYDPNSLYWGDYYIRGNTASASRSLTFKVIECEQKLNVNTVIFLTDPGLIVGNIGHKSATMVRSTSAPTSNLFAGMLWYDTFNNALYLYDGTQWKTVTLT